MTLLVLALVVLALLVLAACAVTTLFVLAERRQLNVLVGRLVSEQRIDAATRATLQAMRDAARQQSRS